MKGAFSKSLSVHKEGHGMKHTRTKVHKVQEQRHGETPELTLLHKGGKAGGTGEPNQGHQKREVKTTAVQRMTRMVS